MNQASHNPSLPAPKVVRIRLWSEVAGISLVLMELTWIAAYYYGLTLHRMPWWAVAVILGGIILISHYLARALNFLHVSQKARRIWFGAWLLIAVYGSLKILVLPNQPVGLFQLLVHPFNAIDPDQKGSLSEFIHMILIILLVWRGVALARAPIEPFKAQRSFQFGIVIFLLYGAMISQLDPAKDFSVLFGFLFFGIVSMAAARIASVTDLRGGRAARLSREWMLAVIAFALLAVGMGLFLGTALRAPVTWVVQQVTDLALFAIGLVVFVLMYPIMLLITALIPLLGKLGESIQGFDIINQLRKIVEEIAKNNQPAPLPDLTGAINIGRIAGRLAIFFGIVAVILIALRWKEIARRSAMEEDVSDIGAGFHWPGPPALNPRRLVQFMQPGRWLAAARIRRIYGQLMQLCEQAGHPRPRAVTPLEFLPQIEELFTAAQADDLRDITHAYVKIRYGEFPETPEEVEQVMSAWERVRAAARPVITQQKLKLKAEKKKPS